MILTNAEYGLRIEFIEGRSCKLILENPKDMAYLAEVLCGQCAGKEGDFLLSCQEKEYKIEKYMEVIVNPFNIDFNSRKILNRLYSELTALAVDYIIEKSELNAKIVQLMEKICSSARYNHICYDMDFDWTDLLKFCKVRMESDNGTLIERLDEYIKMAASLCGIQILCMINISSYLCEEEIRELKQIANYQKMYLLFIEAREGIKDKDEDIYIIDRDRCLIVK